MKHALRFVTVLMLVFGLSSMAVAAPSFFFGENAGNGESTPLASWSSASTAEAQFKANLIGVGTETFEDYSAGDEADLAINFVGAGTATIKGSGEIVSVTPGSTNGFGRYATSGSKFWEGGSSATEFYIDFSDPVAAFGFYGIDIGDFNGQVTVTLSNGQIAVYNVGNTIGIAGGSVLFWGVIDAEHPFTRLSFGNTNAGMDYFAFDDMTIGSVKQVKPTPEPTTMLLLGLGFLGLVGLRKRD